MMRAMPVVLALGVGAWSACGDDGPAATPSLVERLAALGAAPCADLDGWSCVTLAMPRRHAAPDGRTVDVTFAVKPATGAPADHLGLLVTAQGGPGYSGLAWADDFAWIDPRLAERFDAVAFDLRGLFASGGLDCPEAANAWFTQRWRGATSGERAAVAAAADAFVTACVAELGLDAAELTAFRTSEAVADLDAFRAVLDEPRLTLYGLSYGTQFAQAYATAYPDHTRAVVLDGVVDLTLTDQAYATQVVTTQNDVLAQTLATCAAQPACAATFGGDPAAGLATVTAALDAGPVPVTIDVDGVPTERSFSRGDLDIVAYIQLDNPEGRTALLHGLADAAAGDFTTLLGQLYEVWFDASTLDYLADATYADAGYYLYTCNDYGHAPGADVSAQQAAWLAGGADLAADPDQLVLQAYGGDLPCTTWPSDAAMPPRPAAYAAPAPTLFINAAADTATPVVQGRGMVDALRAAGAPVASIDVAGGHHVMFGTDDACVDAATTAFLLDPAPAAAVACAAPLLAAD